MTVRERCSIFLSIILHYNNKPRSRGKKGKKKEAEGRRGKMRVGCLFTILERGEKKKKRSIVEDMIVSLIPFITGLAKRRRRGGRGGEPLPLLLLLSCAA